MNQWMKCVDILRNQSTSVYLNQAAVSGKYFEHYLLNKYPTQANIKISFAFHTTGYFYVHQGCANWCDGVTLKEDGVSFTNLESEVVRCLNQRCLHCGNLGAGVICKASNCSTVLHLPCAAISGAFQDLNSKTVLCSSHLDLTVSLVGDKANCTVCDSPGKISALVLCSNCGCHYHGKCLALILDPGVRAGWQCPACKMCQACRQPGDDGKLLSCDTCDKSYHTFCLRPQLSSIPKHSWKCKVNGSNKVKSTSLTNPA